MAYVTQVMHECRYLGMEACTDVCMYNKENTYWETTSFIADKTLLFNDFFFPPSEPFKSPCDKQQKKKNTTSE